MTRPFIIYALPRSRTVWLSKFLTYGPWKCGHDIVTDYFTPGDIQYRLTEPNFGTVETGMIDGWKLARRLVPIAKILVIKRPVKEVINSLDRAGVSHSAAQIIARAALLDEISAQPDVLSFYYDELDTEEACKKIFEHCLELPFDRDWWLGLRGANIQLNMLKRIEKLQATQSAMQRLKQAAAEMMQ